MRTIIWFSYFWGYLVFLLPRMFRAKKLRANGGDYEAVVNKEIPNWASRLLHLAGAQITVNGKENIPTDRAVVFVCNHEGYFDIPLVLSCLDKPHAIIAKKEIGKMPLIRTWMSLFDCIFIDRDNPRNSMAGLNTAIDLVKNNKSVTIFPEGTRAKGKGLGEFKAGGFRVASKTKVDIVPIAINGTQNLMETNGYWIHPAKVEMTILPAIKTANLDKAALAALPEEIKALIQKALTK